MVQSHLVPPPNVAFNLDLGLAISPDGRSLAYVARPSDDSRESLWIQPLNGAPARPLPGTDGARFPFWSPDSRTVAFFAGNSLMRIEAAGGRPRRLCSPVSVSEGAWGARDVIVFGGFGSSLRGVSAAGGRHPAQSTNGCCPHTAPRRCTRGHDTENECVRPKSQPTTFDDERQKHRRHHASAERVASPEIDQGSRNANMIPRLSVIGNVRIAFAADCINVERQY
jgi:WD40-like Beta Propeller Repeat